jgi:hypothetical protein
MLVEQGIAVLCNPRTPELLRLAGAASSLRQQAAQRALRQQFTQPNVMALATGLDATQVEPTREEVTVADIRKFFSKLWRPTASP